MFHAATIHNIHYATLFAWFWGLRLKPQPLQTPFGYGCGNRSFPHQRQPCCFDLFFLVSWQANFPTSLKTHLNSLYGHLPKIPINFASRRIMENAEPQIPWAPEAVFLGCQAGTGTPAANGSPSAFYQPENFFYPTEFFSPTFFSRQKNIFSNSDQPDLNPDLNSNPTLKIKLKTKRNWNWKKQT